MGRHATDPGVFIRSVATRGHLGGLSRSARDMVRVLDAYGVDIILVETVGVGQDELEITRTRALDARGDGVRDGGGRGAGHQGGDPRVRRRLRGEQGGPATVRTPPYAIWS